MDEEKLGMGRTEVALALKTILDPALYPLCIADVDGVSHTTLVVACLRKLQGWHMDSIVDEISRFAPNYEDLPLVAFISSFCAPPSSSSASAGAPSTADQFTLPPPPYPAWLWPCPPSAQPRPKPRDRSSSTPAATPVSFNPLPFPHPLVARKHPTMRLVFPPLPPHAQTQLQSQPPGQQQQQQTLTALPLNSPGPIVPILPSPAHSDISRMPSLRHHREKSTTSSPTHTQSPPPPPPPATKDDAQTSVSPGPNAGAGVGRTDTVSDRAGSPEQGVLGVAANIVNASLNGIAGVLSSAGVTPPQAEEQAKSAKQAAVETPKDEEREGERERGDLTEGKAANQTITTSMNAFNMNREPTLSSSEMAESSTSGVTASADDVDDQDHLRESEGEEDEDDYDEEEEEEEEEEEDIRATSQYISALDLAGF
ncbi:conserved expressed protein [Cryptococcus deneoformans JEC21]|uniref:Putative tyrosine-protein phosphatase OCA1 n=1 Tax=Cryptococcus deneoformans (strain JEC21 / ATCC MYA-565) TaxID=214684 RepID=Q5KPT2_CRYD1|nr:conserved expressed protein [Cryptococcus neoformans var. neoformans JEC21]AAW40689.2 conserved expressed protein [Cryptococcus neoformans var. neoformans JEC21]